MRIVVQAATPNLKSSHSFYTKAGFSTQQKDNGILVYDKSLMLYINGDRKARSGFLIYTDDYLDKVNAIRKLTAVIEQDDYFLFAFPSGTWAYLLKENTLPENIETSNCSILGQYAGMSMESVDIEKSMKILEVLDFVVSMGGPDQGWVAMSNASDFTISIMKAFSCPHLFFNPSLTYFNSGRNLEIIEDIRNADISITEEITTFNKEGLVDNVIIRDPGGLGFFIFND